MICMNINLSTLTIRNKNVDVKFFCTQRVSGLTIIRYVKLFTKSHEMWLFHSPFNHKNLIQHTISLEMPVPSQGHYSFFHSIPVVDWFCLLIYLWVLTFPSHIDKKNIFDIFVDFLIYMHFHYMKMHGLSSSLQRRNIFRQDLGIGIDDRYTSSASFLDLFLEFDDCGQLSTNIYDKRDDFNFKIINFPNMCSNIWSL
jgi:hypothetical protein